MTLAGLMCQILCPWGGYQLKSLFFLPSDCSFSRTAWGLPCAWGSGVSRGFMGRLSPDWGLTSFPGSPPSVSSHSKDPGLCPLDTAGQKGSVVVGHRETSGETPQAGALRSTWFSSFKDWTPSRFFLLLTAVWPFPILAFSVLMRVYNCALSKGLPSTHWYSCLRNTGTRRLSFPSHGMQLYKNHWKPTLTTVCEGTQNTGPHWLWTVTSSSYIVIPPYTFWDPQGMPETTGHTGPCIDCSFLCIRTSSEVSVIN